MVCRRGRGVASNDDREEPDCSCDRRVVGVSLRGPSQRGRRVQRLLTHCVAGGGAGARDPEVAKRSAIEPQR